MKARRRTLTKIALPVGAALIMLSAPGGPVSATPHTTGTVRDPAMLRRQVVHLFDRLDRVSRVIERVRVQMSLVDERIADLSREIEAGQRALNRRAAEAYMSGRAGEIESVLGATSLGDLQDAFQFIEAVSQKDHDLLVSLRRLRGELEVQHEGLEALAGELRGRREWLESTASDLAEQLRLQKARAERADLEAAASGSTEESPASVTSSESFAPAPPSSPEAMMSLIRERFASLGSATTRVALCVAEHESNFDPLVVNPATQASGLFQFLPSTWQALSELAGWSGSSVFDARANASVAAWTVSRYGWHPWRSVAAACGA